MNQKTKTGFASFAFIRGKFFFICVGPPNLRPLKNFPLNNLQPPLNFIRFFNPLRFFVASTFVARL